MVRWFALASVPSRALGAGEVGDVLHKELVRVVYQLLGVSHLRVEMAHDVQSVDRVRISAVSLLLRDKVQEFTGTSDGLKLLLRRNPLLQFLALLSNPPSTAESLQETSRSIIRLIATLSSILDWLVVLTILSCQGHSF